MAVAAFSGPAKRSRISIIPFRAPPKAVEYLFYVFVFYSIMGGALGLPLAMVGGGALLLIALSCVISLGFQSMMVSMMVYGPIALLIACAIVFLFVQVAIFGIPATDDNCRPFITWILGMLVILALDLRRGFLHRFAIVLFLIGLATLPYLGFLGGGFGIDRAMIHEKVSGNLSNPNGLGEWFGFCAVYFLVLGLQTRRGLLRACAWAAAVTCLYVVGLTVSRGAILATAIASLFAIQHILKRGFVPVFVLIVFAWVVLESGLFGHALSLYSLRGTEETGRFLVWPVAFERFLSSPLVGVGAADVATYVPERKGHVTPHNTLIYFGLASGVFPLILFLAFWIQMACRHLSRNEIFEESVFRKPFLVYAFVVSMTGDLSFMAPWGLLALSPGIRSVLRFQASPLVKGKRRMDEPVDVPGPTGWVAR